MGFDDIKGTIDGWISQLNPFEKLQAIGRIQNLQQLLQVGDSISDGLIQYVQMLKIGEAFHDWIKLNETIRSTNKMIGASVGQMERMSAELSKASGYLGLYYNIDESKMVESINRLAEATGRVRLPLKAELEDVAYMTEFGQNGLLGSFDKIGVSVSVATARFMQLQQNAGALGLNLSKVTKEVDSNLSNVNRYNFKNGVNGMQQMALFTEQMKLNMGEVLNFAEKIQNSTEAIQTSASLQMLGGSFANTFGNPLELMYMANYDVAQLAERTERAVANLGKFNKETGEVEFSAMAKRQLKEFEKATGIKAFDAANRRALVNAMESQFSQALTQTQKDMITNRATYDAKSGRFKVMDVYGKERDVADIKSAEDVRNIVSDKAEDAQLDIRDNVRVIAQYMRERMRVKGSENLTLAETFQGIRSWTIKPMMEMFQHLGGKKGSGDGFIFENGLPNTVRDLKEHSFVQFGTFTLPVDQITRGGGSGGGTVGGEIVNSITTVGGIASLAAKLAGGYVFKGISDNYIREQGIDSGEYWNQAQASAEITQKTKEGNEQYIRGLDDFKKTSRPDNNAVEMWDFKAPFLPNALVPGAAWTDEGTVSDWFRSRPSAPTPIVTPPYMPPSISKPEEVPAEAKKQEFEFKPYEPKEPETTTGKPETESPERRIAYRPYVPFSADRPEQKGEEVEVIAKAKDVAEIAVPGASVFRTIATTFEQNAENSPLSTAYAKNYTPASFNQVDGRFSDFEYYKIKNGGDEQKAKADYMNEVKSYAQEVEGIVDINDPQLEQKAFTSVIKIHELLVAKYGSMEVKQTSGAEIKSQRIDALQVTPQQTTNPNNVRMVNNPQQGESKKELVLTINGNLTVNGNKISQTELKNWLKDRDVLNLISDELKRLNGQMPGSFNTTPSKSYI